MGNVFKPFFVNGLENLPVREMVVLASKAALSKRAILLFTLFLVCDFFISHISFRKLNAYALKKV